MISTLQTLVLLLAVVAAVAVVAARLQIPTAIPLVLAGVGLALVPALPDIELAPELVLLLVLPPIVYFSAVQMSWLEFRFNLRPIALLSVGCVLFTTLAVAAATHYLLGLAWPVGFLLGAIVSPPDAVAPLSIARRLQIPHRILVVLEGEGLANDATALILYRFAIVAIGSGLFSPGKAMTTFFAIVAGEILWGLAAGWLTLRLRRWIAEPRIELTLSLLSPFLAFWPPQALGGSGVLAAVTAGLYTSWDGQRLISAATRLQGIFFWDFLLYLIEGMVFLITGLQARTLLDRIVAFPHAELAFAAAIVTGVVIVARFAWLYPATYLPRCIPSVRRKDPSPPWTYPTAIAFTGVRGIVSLAAALAIPFATDDGRPFPDRDLILFLTFVVILVTLVGQGLLLPAIIRALGLAHTGRRERREDRAEEYEARRLAIGAVIDRLGRLAVERRLPDALVRPLHALHRERLRHIEQRSDGDAAHLRLSRQHEEIERLLIAEERDQVNRRFRDGKLKDEARRRIERDLDLREASLANQGEEESLG
jgi:monovalent cation/hydrogen antiporter